MFLDFAKAKSEIRKKEGMAVKFYEHPEIEIHNVESADVIATSPVNGGVDSPLVGIDPDSNLIP